jgi:hypothetical protein
MKGIGPENGDPVAEQRSTGRACGGRFDDHQAS